MGALTRAADHLTLEQIKEQMNATKDPKQLRRWLIVYTALLQPRKAEEIASSVGVSKSLVHKVISRYNKDGIPSIQIKASGGRYHEYLTIEEEKQFLAPFFELAEKGALVTTATMLLAYQERVGHAVHEATIYRLLERHGWRKVQPRPRHPKAKKQEQETFKKKLKESIQEAQQGRKPEDHRPVLFMIQDEARFGRITSYRRCWAPRKVRPCTPHQIIRECLSVFTAVAPQSGEICFLVFPTCNTNAMTIFLEYVSKQFSTSFIVMQVDGAGWHRSHELQVPENIRLLFQPPYSPEVNPVEHIWDDLREKHFSNRQFPSLDALQEELCSVLNDLSDHPKYIRSMTYFPHIRFACENAN